jgi:hypothetical protein
MPYHVTWVHETHAPELPGHAAARLRAVAAPHELPRAVASLAAAAAAEPVPAQPAVDASRPPSAIGVNA